MTIPFPRAAAATVAALLLAGCHGEPEPVMRESSAMNTFVTITAYRASDRQGAEAAIDAALAEIRRIEEMATDYSDSSAVGRVNLSAGRDTVGVPAELVSLVRRAIALGEASGGAFDVTVGPLVKAWDFLAAAPHALAPDTVAMLRTLVDYRQIVLRDSAIFLPRPRMAIDLGGIAKGYAVDRAMAVLREHGVRHCIVDIGGNLAVAWPGTHGLDSAAATILIRHPRRDGAFFGRFRCGAGGISTSGDYQRFFMENGRRYHHILDPSTGWPSPNAAAVTVVAESAELADALSTALFVLGPVRGMEYLARHPGAEALFVTEDGDSLRWQATPGFARSFRPGPPDD